MGVLSYTRLHQAEKVAKWYASLWKMEQMQTQGPTLKDVHRCKNSRTLGGCMRAFDTPNTLKRATTVPQIGTMISGAYMSEGENFDLLDKDSLGNNLLETYCGSPNFFSCLISQLTAAELQMEYVRQPLWANILSTHVPLFSPRPNNWELDYIRLLVNSPNTQHMVHQPAKSGYTLLHIVLHKSVRSVLVSKVKSRYCTQEALLRSVVRARPDLHATTPCTPLTPLQLILAHRSHYFESGYWSNPEEAKYWDRPRLEIRPPWFRFAGLGLDWDHELEDRDL
ncbi:hypothetical protein N656DRAFT_336240 [Canariomyces notabilis]|uniref:Uncharacterized protein n=1 Tax=Canariomyces notabilis TaxID=2074819 RepID=A0AAN6QFP8_9PEZI|nr:hypothetical protein N656DRAFT_336240 [Canariomyces arenarius]